MTRRNWNKENPRSLRHALELCVDYGRIKRNLSVERIAELMGLSGHHTLYKWLSTGRIPGNMIRPFEHACGHAYVSRYLAHSARFITVPVPTGRRANARTHAQLQKSLNTAVTSLIDFSEQKIDTAECLALVNEALADLAWHRANVEKHDQPEFEFFDEEEP